MSISENLKDALFNDDLFNLMVRVHGADAMHRELVDFVSDLALQLRVIDKGEKWRRSVTALIIRGKKRLRELEV